MIRCARASSEGEIAVVVERQLLWIAQASVNDFQVGAIRVTAQHSAGIDVDLADAGEADSFRKTILRNWRLAGNHQ